MAPGVDQQGLLTVTAMLYATAIALVYDGQLALVVVGALVGLLAPSPFQSGRVEKALNPPA